MLFNKANLFLYISKVLKDEKKGLLPSMLKSFLFFISQFYLIAITLRNFLYDKKFLKQKKVNAVVISIGNITAGGSGKTPFTMFLAEKLNKKLLAVISRGYLSKFENKNVHIPKEKYFSSLEIGDEPFLIKKHLNIDLFIGKNRLLSCEKAIKNNFKILILDDAMQHRKLFRDFEIVLINANDLLKKEFLLPRGFFREPKKNLKRADLIVVNNLKDLSDLDSLKKIIQKFSKANIIAIKPCFNGFKDIFDKSISIKPKTQVALFCAVANPGYFERLVESQDLQIEEKLFLSDHEKISEKKFKEFISKCLAKNVKYIISTEKDIVKFEKESFYDIPLIYLSLKLEVISKEAYIENLVEKINEMVNN